MTIYCLYLLFYHKESKKSLRFFIIWEKIKQTLKKC